ncbi:unnamed protein product [Rotaria sp. Silwood2]|nr:unnamed protein product [Rotaria sp. Silwood2]
MTNVYLLHLPTEIFHCIFDYLDTPTILRSIRCACSQLHAIVNTYDHFELEFKSIDIDRIKFISDVIGIENITSLIFSIGNSKQSNNIDLALSIFTTRQSNRLRSLTLLEIFHSDLNQLLPCINALSLVSLTIHLCGTYAISTNTPRSIITLQSSLQKFHLKGLHSITNTLSWPTHCILQSLTIEYCSFKEYQFILDHCPLLRTLVIERCSLYDINVRTMTTSTFRSYTQLTSLIMCNIYLSFDELSVLLSLTRSLINLKIISWSGNFYSLCDGSKWEEFIQNKLPRLNNFEFCFRQTLDYNNNHPSHHSIINLYRTPFWLEKKHWYVTCDCVIRSSFASEIILYTMPIKIDNIRLIIRCQALSMDNLCYFTKYQLNHQDEISEREVCIKCSSITDINDLFFDC